MPNSLFPFGADAVRVEGAEKAQATLRDLERRVSERHGLLDTMTLVTGMLHRYASSIVHVRTGRLKNSLFWRTSQRGNSVIGIVQTNVEYAPDEHAKGGTHAFFTRTIREEGPRANSIFTEQVSIRA